MRTLKSLGTKGSDVEQAENPFLREGAIYTARVGAPILGSLAIRRSPDLVGGFYPPEFYYYTQKDLQVNQTVLNVTPDDAFAAAKLYDDLFFPEIGEVNLLGISEDTVSEIRSLEAQAFATAQGLRS